MVCRKDLEVERSPTLTAYESRGLFDVVVEKQPCRTSLLPTYPHSYPANVMTPHHACAETQREPKSSMPSR